MQNPTRSLYLCASILAVGNVACLPSKGHSIADQNVPDIHVPQPTVLRFLGRAPRPVVNDELPTDMRDPFLTEEEQQAVEAEEWKKNHPDPVVAVAVSPPPPQSPPTVAPVVIPPKNPPASVAGLLIGAKPMFFFKDDTYGVGDKFMGEWIVDAVTEDRASMHWEKSKAFRASMHFSRDSVLEIRKG
jgi:hypothetical protein